MAYCKDCLHYDVCKRLDAVVEFEVDDGVCLTFAPNAHQHERNALTHADRIRSMTDVELAKAMHSWISTSVCDYCMHNNEGPCDGSLCLGEAEVGIIGEWLQQPVEEDI